MPFREVSRMDARLEFVMLASEEGANVRQLCRRFGISPTTGHKWLERWRTAGMTGLQEQSRRPRTSPARSVAAIEEAVLALRAEHPAWGGRKIARRLKDLGREAVPAPSTVTAILKRHGMELGTFGGGQSAFVRFERERPNELWQMDFKGHVAMHTGRLHPLTVLDDHSRFSVVLAACANEQTETVQQHLVAAFRRYGLPERLITDNGSPWGDGPGSPFTPLGVWLIEHGIKVSHSRPYHPQTMGKDERFHRSLKAEVLSAPAFADIAAAQRAFERWRTVYNTQRPHEALELAVPASRYQPSPRDYVETVAPFEYAPNDVVRRVQQGGHVRFLGRNLKVPKAFRGKAIAFRPTTQDGVFDVVFRTQTIATVDIRPLDGSPESVHDVSEHPSTISPV
ncbi:IS481 family transposase [Bradyrhizobium sp. WBOS7]|uniref:IS481 family transposase n=1 Tax=Bradyrhizobium betae TaxID=244734 RepID=A0AAE9NF07_9BRAD|nr:MULTISPECIES: IS481 family transposase [Bradyrhizobium]MDD1581316.1 IS481 family transposase [Bradyrhizobium sp. WBOS7]MDD1605058.1 IS481 family transposase [Bradyrhizobium sp. WBOS16]UUO57152.1 IS481 family transposase [Bradyrhizobium sp. WBOS07]UUO69386.1 IS481 family transposase [Bradyrhizobium betae]